MNISRKNAHFERKNTPVPSAPDVLVQAIKGVEKSFEEIKQLNEDREKEVKGLGSNLKTIDERTQSYEQKMSALMDEIVELKRAQTLIATPAGQLSAEDREVKNAMIGYVRNGSKQKSLSSLASPDGGYFVHTDTTGRIVTRIRDRSPLRQYANIQVISTSDLEGLLDRDEADAGWTGEASPRSNTGTPRVGKWKIPVHEMYAQPTATQTLLDDAATDVETWLQNKIADRMARLEQYGFVLGDGNSKPKGFMSYAAAATTQDDNARAAGKLQYVKTGAAADFKAAPNGGDVFIETSMEMRPEYATGAVWAMNRRTLAAVMKLKDGDGNYLWTPDFTKGASGLLVGIAVDRSFDHMPDVGAGTFPVALGNFNEAYQIVDRQGIRIIRDNLTEKPFVKFYTTRRVGGDVVNFDALKLIKCAA